MTRGKARQAQIGAAFKPEDICVPGRGGDGVAGKDAVAAFDGHVVHPEDHQLRPVGGLLPAVIRPVQALRGGAQVVGLSGEDDPCIGGNGGEQFVHRCRLHRGLLRQGLLGRHRGEHFLHGGLGNLLALAVHKGAVPALPAVPPADHIVAEHAVLHHRVVIGREAEGVSRDPVVRKTALFQGQIEAVPAVQQRGGSGAGDFTAGNHRIPAAAEGEYGIAALLPVADVGKLRILNPDLVAAVQADAGAAAVVDMAVQKLHIGAVAAA